MPAPWSKIPLSEKLRFPIAFGVLFGFAYFGSQNYRHMYQEQIEERRRKRDSSAIEFTGDKLEALEKAKNELIEINKK